MRIGKIDITGDSEFVHLTENALRMIERKDPARYRQVQAYLSGIQLTDDPSEMVLDTGVYKVNRKTAFHSLLFPEENLMWYASSIVHEAEHNHLHSNGLDWYDKGNRQAHEEGAAHVQLRFLETAGAPHDMRRHVQSEMDGRYWETSEKRAW